MSRVPFDPVFDAQIDSCLRLASVEDHARALAEKAVKAERLAMEAKERARLGTDLVEVGAAAQTAQESAIWCGRLAAAVRSLLGSGDVETVSRCAALERAAIKHAATAEGRWSLVKRAQTVGEVPHA